MSKVVFVFDQVRHFHIPLFEGLEHRFRGGKIELSLCRGSEGGGNARGSVNKKVIANEETYELHELKIRSYTIRLALGYLGIIYRLKPDIVVCPAHPGDLGHWALIALSKLVGFKLVAWHLQ
jgi:hypothetical protein